MTVAYFLMIFNHFLNIPSPVTLSFSFSRKGATTLRIIIEEFVRDYFRVDITSGIFIYFYSIRRLLFQGSFKKICARI